MKTSGSVMAVSSAIMLVAFLALQGGPVCAQVVQLETQELVFAHMAVGGGWESELTLVAQGADTSSGRIRFLNQIGDGLTVRVNGGPEVTSTTYSLPAKSSRTFELTSNGPTAAGWIIVSSDVAGNVNRGSINGTLTYRYLDQGVVISQVGILPSQAVTRSHVPFDETNTNMSAIAVATYNRMDLGVECYRDDGVLLQSTMIHFQPMTQQALYVKELFPGATRQRGFLVLKGSAPFNMTALNVNMDKWSDLAILPGVFERDLTVSVGDLSNYRIRLVQNGTFFYGTAEMTSPRQGVYRPISGCIANTGQHSVLQLNLHSSVEGTGEGLNITLIAPVSDLRLVSVSGRAVATKEDGNVTASGTFSISTPASAQF